MNVSEAAVLILKYRKPLFSNHIIKKKTDTKTSGKYNKLPINKIEPNYQ